MKKSIPLLCLVMLATLTACDRNRIDAENAVRAALKDPESARFGDFYFNEKTRRGCFTVNAKNSMGGYTGNQQVYVNHSVHGWIVSDMEAVDVAYCRKIYADRSE